jgi:anti-sigma regulatory factor (Ser/Thr protein kinase)
VTTIHEQVFPGLSEAVRDVRAAVGRCLTGLPADVVYDAKVAASELASNTLLHTDTGQRPGGKFTLGLEIGARYVLVAVTDQGSSDGNAPELNPTPAEHGRGLAICRALGELGIESTPDGGRRVSVRLSLPSDERRPR